MRFATVKVPFVPLSVKVNNVFGEPSASLIVNTPLFPVVAKVSVGVLFESVRGLALDNVSVPEASIVVAPLIAPALVIPPVLLLIPPVIEAPPDVTVRAPPIVWPTVKLLSCPLYATLDKVPVVFMLVPFNKNAVVALMFATARVPVVPLSVRVKSVFGEPLESLIVRTPAAFPAPNVTIGFVLENVRGEALDRVTVPEASIVVAPEIAPVPVIPPVLFEIPPVIFAPPALIVRPPEEIVCSAVNVFA